MKEFKVGDKVRIRKDLKVGELYGDVYFAECMGRMCGKIATINATFPTLNVFMTEGNMFFWSLEMVEPINQVDKLIFRDNVTILIKDGKRYIAKCEAGDTYDREKGMLVALAKANGYTFDDIQKMLNNAEIQGKNMQVREVKRLAEVGEYIKLTRAEYSFNKVGDVLRVDNRINGLAIVYNSNQPRETGYNLAADWGYLPHEYVVLENYKPRAN